MVVFVNETYDICKSGRPVYHAAGKDGYRSIFVELRAGQCIYDVFIKHVVTGYLHKAFLTNSIYLVPKHVCDSCVFLCLQGPTAVQ